MTTSPEHTPGLGRKLLLAAFAAAAAAVAFAAFVQASKTPPFAEANPFAVDPYDAVGSFTFQIALVAGGLSLARAIRLRRSGWSARRAQLVLRGVGLVVLAIGVTVAVDLIAVARQPGQVTASTAGALLASGLAAVTLLAAVSALAGWRLIGPLRRAAQRRAASAGPPLTLADALDDLWAPVAAAADWLRARRPELDRPLRWAAGLSSDAVFTRARLLRWADPRRHPWLLAVAAALAAGVALATAQAFEGGPPTRLLPTLLVGLLFIGVESIAALSGFLLLGGYLGLRPPLRARGH